VRQLNPVIATEGQTDFTIPGGYTPGALLVTINGVIIPPTDCTATNGATITLVAGVREGDELGVIAFGA